MLRTEAAGDEQVVLRHVPPLAHHGLVDGWVAGLQVDVGRAGGQVQLADGVAGHGVRLAYGHVVLEVVGAELPQVQRLPAPPVQQEARQVEIAPLARVAVQLYQGRLDLRMPGDAGAPGWSEHRVDMVGKAPGYVQQLPVAGGPVIGDRGLHQVPGAVHLVASAQILPAPVRLDDLPVRVQVTVVGLRRSEQVDGLFGPAQQLGVGPRGEIVGGRLQPLVYVGVGEEHASELALAPPHRQAQVVEVARRLQLPVAMIEAGAPVDGLPPGPEALAEGDAASRQCPPPGVGALGSVDRSSGHGRPSGSI